MVDSKYTLELTVPVDEQLLHDVMVTAIESGHFGIGYWAEVKNIKRHPEDGTSKALDILEFMCREQDASTPDRMEGTGKPGRWIKVDAAKVLAGYKVCLKKDFKLRQDIKDAITRSVMDGDGGDIDSDAADVLIQAALFGTLVYG